jgi:hypothetical protein
MSYHPIGDCCASCATKGPCSATVSRRALPRWRADSGVLASLGTTGGNLGILSAAGGKLIASGQQNASPVDPMQNLPTDRLPLYLAGIGVATLGLVLFLTRR